MGIHSVYRLMGNDGLVEYHLDEGYHVRFFVQKGWLGGKKRVWVIVRYR